MAIEEQKAEEAAGQRSSELGGGSLYLGAAHLTSGCRSGRHRGHGVTIHGFAVVGVDLLQSLLVACHQGLPPSFAKLPRWRAIASHDCETLHRTVPAGR